MASHSHHSTRPILFALLITLSLPALSCADAQETGGESDQASSHSASSPSASVEAAIPSIETAELAARLQSGEAAPTVLDVRTQAEFDAGHIPGALHIPYDELPDRLAEVDTTKDVVVHCMVGPRARKAEATLAAAGVEGIVHLEGGYRAWMQAGLETTK